MLSLVSGFIWRLFGPDEEQPLNEFRIFSCTRLSVARQAAAGSASPLAVDDELPLVRWMMFIWMNENPFRSNAAKQHQANRSEAMKTPTALAMTTPLIMCLMSTVEAVAVVAVAVAVVPSGGGISRMGVTTLLLCISSSAGSVTRSIAICWPPPVLLADIKSASEAS